MPEPVKTRGYRSPRRKAQAAATRSAVVAAARDRFFQKGYAATTVAAIARHAGVSVDTVYTAVGRKPELVLAVIDEVLGGAAAEQREYVQVVRRQQSARGKLEVYAAAVARLVPEIAPLQEALRKAAETDRACSRTWRGLVSRRADNMRLLAAELRSTGEVRRGLMDEEVADILWSTNAPEYWQLLEQRGWNPERYERLLVDLWTRILLTE
ncbi:MAG: helix-turn-helix domain-containing protein [Candidatus Nanopelagicales bacterium]